MAGITLVFVQDMDTQEGRAITVQRRIDMRIWMFNPPEKKDKLERLQEAGVSRVVCTNNAVRPCQDLGMHTYTMIQAFRHTSYPEDLAIDIEQTPVEWFSSGCPNSPRIRQYFYARMQELLSQPVQGVFLDGVRFSSPASSSSPTSFFTCFCPRCQEDMVRRGYDRDMIMRDVASVANLFLEEQETGRNWLLALRSPSGWMAFLQRFPGFGEWLSYRVNCITDFVREVRQWLNVNYPAQKLGGFLFQPALSFLVGQNYQALGQYLDIISPMIYRNYPDSPGPAAINQEILSMANHLGKEGVQPREEMQLITNLLSVFGLPAEWTPDLAMSESHVASETTASRVLSSDGEIVPIIWAGDPKLANVLNELSTSGVEDCILFTYDAGMRAHDGSFLSIIANQ